MEIKEKKLRIAVFSDDSEFRAHVVAMLGKHPWHGSPTVVTYDAATAQGLLALLTEKPEIQAVVLDGETQKDGAMSVSHTIEETVQNPPKKIFVVARQQDEWLARNAGSDAVLLKPLSPMSLSKSLQEVI